jgi:hypothetical protein
MPNRVRLLCCVCLHSWLLDVGERPEDEPRECPECRSDDIEVSY